MAGKATQYHHGEMDIHAQRATFHAVLVGTKWGCLAVAVTILLLTLWFCTNAGFITALFSAALLTGVGVFALHERRPSH